MRTLRTMQSSWQLAMALAVISSACNRADDGAPYAPSEVFISPSRGGGNPSGAVDAQVRSDAQTGTGSGSDGGNLDGGVDGGRDGGFVDPRVPGASGNGGANGGEGGTTRPDGGGVRDAGPGRGEAGLGTGDGGLSFDSGLTSRARLWARCG